MPQEKPPSPPARKPRADAQRNREHILRVAKELFLQTGASPTGASLTGASPTMDEIARNAKIGPGTLYRHFPTREALIEAVYHNEVEKLAAAERHFAATLPPIEALRAWMNLFIDHVSTKRFIIPAMETVTGGSARLIEGSRSTIHPAFLKLVNRAIASGDLRADTNPNDFVRALIGVFFTTAMPGWEESARRIVEILIAGSRAHP